MFRSCDQGLWAQFQQLMVTMETQGESRPGNRCWNQGTLSLGEEQSKEHKWSIDRIVCLSFLAPGV